MEESTDWVKGASGAGCLDTTQETLSVLKTAAKEARTQKEKERTGPKEERMGKAQKVRDQQRGAGRAADHTISPSAPRQVGVRTR